MENKIYDLFKKIGLSASIAMAISLLINVITKVMIIKIVVLAALIVAVCLFLFFKNKKLLLPVGLASIVGIVASLLLKPNISLAILVALAVFVLLDKVSLLLKLSLFIGLSLLIAGLTNNIIIEAAILVIEFVLIGIHMIKEKEDKYVLSIVAILLAIILSILLPKNVSLSIIACLVSFMLVNKVPTSFKPVAFAIIFTTLLTWILPISYFSNGELITEGKTELGLFDLFSYPNIVISYFGNNFIYLLVIGGFYGVLYKTGALSKLLKNLAKKIKPRSKLIVSLLTAFIAIIVAVTGASIGMWMIIPFVIALILALGYDKITAAMVSVGSISLGLMGNLFSSTYISSEYSMSAQNGAGIVNNVLGTNPMSLLLPKALILIFEIVLLIVAILLHMKKSVPESSEEMLEYVPETKTSNKVKVWPLVLVFDLSFLIVLLSYTSWTSVFKLDIFTKATEFVLTKVNISGFPILGKILGEIKPFEQWGLVEVSTLLVLASFVLSLVYKVKFKDFVEAFVNGAKKAFKPAILVALVFTILVIVSYNPITLTIIKPILDLTKNFNVFTTSLTAFIASIFNVDIYYVALNCLQYPVQLIQSLVDSGKITEVQQLAIHKQMALSWYSMYGFASLVAPTSVILIAVLSYLNIPYKKWLKSNWLFIIGSLLLMMIVFTGCLLFVK